MKYLFIPILFIALPCGALCQTAPTQPTKSALVDFDKVLTQSAAGQVATKEFEQNLKTRQQQLDVKQKQLTADSQAFQKKQASMSPAQAQKRAQELQQQYQQLQLLYTQLEKQLVAKRTALIQQIIKEAQPHIKSLCKEKGILVLFDRATIVYADRTFYNMTDDIITRMNKEKR